MAVSSAVLPRLSVFAVFTANTNFVWIFWRNYYFKSGTACMNLRTSPRTRMIQSLFFILWLPICYCLPRKYWFDHMTSSSQYYLSLYFPWDILKHCHNYLLSHRLFWRKKINNLTGQAWTMCRFSQTSPRKLKVFEARGRLLSAYLKAVTSKQSQTTKASGLRIYNNIHKLT